MAAILCERRARDGGKVVSKPVAVEWAEEAEELHERFVAERDLERRKRLQALWLLRRGERVSEAAQHAGVGKRTLERWLGWYRAGGLENVLGRIRGHGAKGAPGKLSGEQVERLAERAGRGVFRTYGEAAEWVHSAYGVSYSYNGIWSLLTRRAIHPHVPRPTAEKADPQAQAAYKRGGWRPR